MLWPMIYYIRPQQPCNYNQIRSRPTSFDFVFYFSWSWMLLRLCLWITLSSIVNHAPLTLVQAVDFCCALCITAMAWNKASSKGKNSQMLWTELTIQFLLAGDESSAPSLAHNYLLSLPSLPGNWFQFGTSHPKTVSLKQSHFGQDDELATLWNGCPPGGFLLVWLPPS